MRDVQFTYTPGWNQRSTKRSQNGEIPPFLYNCIISKNMGDKGPSLSLVENRSASNAGGVGNYKGVMLCNRPFAGTVGRLMNICCIV